MDLGSMNSPGLRALSFGGASNVGDVPCLATSSRLYTSGDTGSARFDERSGGVLSGNAAVGGTYLKSLVMEAFIRRTLELETHPQLLTTKLPTLRQSAERMTRLGPLLPDGVLLRGCRVFGVDCVEVTDAVSEGACTGVAPRRSGGGFFFAFLGCRLVELGVLPPLESIGGGGDVGALGFKCGVPVATNENKGSCDVGEARLEGPGAVGEQAFMYVVVRLPRGSMYTKNECLLASGEREHQREHGFQSISIKYSKRMWSDVR